MQDTIELLAEPESLLPPQATAQDRLARALAATRRILRIIVSGLLMLLVLVTLAFTMLHMAPGDPAATVAGPDASAAEIAQVRDQLGLNQPLWEQYGSYISGLLHGDLGISYVKREPVQTLVWPRFLMTLQLALLATAITFVLGVFVGFIVAITSRDGRRGPLLKAFTTITSVASATPDFLAATLLALIFAVWLPLLPVAGSSSFLSYALPVAAICVRPVSVLSRVVWIETSNAMKEDYVLTARSKYLSLLWIAYFHILRNVLASAVTVLSIVFAELIGGTVIVEVVFNWPGLGTALTNAVNARDYPVVQGAVLLLGFCIVLINRTTEVVLSAIDPRLLLKEKP